MKAILRRILRLEVLATPQRNERGETLADVIQAGRRRLFEMTGQTFEAWPQECFAGARSIPDMILRSRELRQQSMDRGSALGA